tara:strand:+ start:25588 stop:26559 length:972 start_codon:yes stop_codon:yes gene_type:complete
MPFVQERKSKGNKYIYIDKSIRIGGKIYKVSKYLGKKSALSKATINKAIKNFDLQANSKILAILMKNITKKYSRLQYPLSYQEIEKIETMNLKYKQIKNRVTKEQWLDIKKRFVANFVFESNALEGNSLTLRNFSEIVFEERITGSTDLREVYDAKNSYAVFSHLFDSKKDLTENYIKEIHKRIVKNIDNRIGYKKFPNEILGRRLKLTEPKDVETEMLKLLNWYHHHKDKIYPLELAFKFHHRFEKIHPFADGNGRVGRMLLNLILIKQGYFPIIIRKTNRSAYLKALQAADQNKNIPLIRFALDKIKATYRKFFEVYYSHL